ncbi:MAG: YceI family protein [Bryobacteraceae bacterium]|jgi:polyisoprenoid-binding protein YceI
MSKAIYQIDSAHSSAQFTVRHLMISNVRGEFTKLSGSIAYDPADPASSSIDATIDAASINTREAQRDAHLKSADFFDVERFPVLTFRGKEVGIRDGEGTVKGDLTMHGVTREVVLRVEGPTPEAKDPWGNMRIGATATAKINRKDFGLNWNAALEAGGVLVGEEVKITIDLEAIRQG